jgi:hypothetical protein
MARTAYPYPRALLLVVSLACFAACNSPQENRGSAPDTYVGRSVAAYVTDHGYPNTTSQLTDREARFQWVTQYKVGPAIGEGPLIAGAPPAEAACTVILSATTQSPNPELKDWIIQSVSRQGVC